MSERTLFFLQYKPSLYQGKEYYIQIVFRLYNYEMTSKFPYLQWALTEILFGTLFLLESSSCTNKSSESLEGVCVWVCVCVCSVLLYLSAFLFLLPSNPSYLQTGLVSSGMKVLTIHIATCKAISQSFFFFFLVTHIFLHDKPLWPDSVWWLTRGKCAAT